MRNPLMTACSLAGVAICSSGALAWHFETRLVERIGNTDVPMADNVQFEIGSTHRVRVQFGIFDDAAGVAPAGGYAGWNVGTLSTTAGSWSRTPGRISPFILDPRPTANGSPIEDPFISLTRIDNTLGFQAITWECDGSGQPLPPPPVIRGLNTFISTYEVTVQAPDVASTINVAWGGHVIALARWDYSPELSVLPDCETGEAGMVFYTPYAPHATQTDFTQSLRIQVVVPSPGAGVVALVFGCGAVIRRRR